MSVSVIKENVKLFRLHVVDTYLLILDVILDVICYSLYHDMSM